ncbi:general transcription factor IIF subunit 2-like [Centruroides sculpturatus]|uniref:general transcription factor IIF subunit 2-like n=1 Tax=Centruroides sculpturatus TaxID=218467 RepID=UPI000C6D134B|nr:general transcription factor IIF subunit 2-like [Centruroides sculpturatus]
MSGDLDCTNAKRGVWLVKVPKYLSSRWKKAPPKTEVGRLKIRGAMGKPDIKFTLNDEIVNMKEPTEKTGIPKEHQFAVTKIFNQTLAVFSSTKHDNSSGPETQTGSGLVLEGHVIRKGECRPMGDDQYMKLKMHTIIQASQPERQVKHLKKIVQNYKPISDHKNNIQLERKKHKVYALFLDLDKAYDSISIRALQNKMSQFSADNAMIKLTGLLFGHYDAIIRHNDEQGYPYPIDHDDGFMIGDTVIHSVSYADDIVIIAPTAAALNRKIQKWG